MSYGLQVYSASGEVILENNSNIIRLLLVVNFPSLGYGTTWVFSHPLITTECVAIMFSHKAHVRFYSGYLELVTIPIRPGYSGFAISSGTFKVFKR